MAEIKKGVMRAYILAICQMHKSEVDSVQLKMHLRQAEFPNREESKSFKMTRVI